jgi:hypothetical protein
VTPQLKIAGRVVRNIGEADRDLVHHTLQQLVDADLPDVACAGVLDRATAGSSGGRWGIGALRRAPVARAVLGRDCRRLERFTAEDTRRGSARWDRVLIEMRFWAARDPD